jgi:hypothetical protein
MHAAQKTAENVSQTRHLVRVLDFTTTPGARYVEDGPFPGEVFREKVLRPAFERAQADNRELRVDLDGIWGYATSFLEEAFGGLAQIYGPDVVERLVKIKCDDEPELLPEILGYIRKGKSRTPRPRPVR